MQRKLADSIPLVTDKFFDLPGTESAQDHVLPFPLPVSPDTLLSFIASNDGKQFSLGTKQLLENIKQWLISCNIDNPALNSNIDEFANRFTDTSIQLVTNLKARFELCSQGIQNLNLIYAYIQSDVHFINHRKTILSELIQQLSKCDDGVCSYIKDTQQLLSSNPAVQLQSIRTELARQAAIELLTPAIRNEDIYPGEEIHWVNAFLNHYHQELGIDPIKDTLMPPEEYFHNAKEPFIQTVTKRLVPKNIIATILHRVDLHSIEEIIKNDFTKGSKQLEQALNIYGEDHYFSLKQLFDETALEDEGIIKFSDNTRHYLASSLFERLKNSGYFKSKFSQKIKINEVTYVSYAEHPLFYSFITLNGEAGKPERIPFPVLIKTPRLLRIFEAFVNHPQFDMLYDAQKQYSALSSLLSDRRLNAFKILSNKISHKTPLEHTQILQLTGHAITNNHVEILKHLFKLYPQFNPNLVSNNVDPILHWLINNNHLNMLRVFLAHPAIDVNRSNNHKETALHEAVKTDNAELITTLLSHRDTQLNLKDAEGDTPLHVALDNSNMTAFELLLADTRTNPNAQVHEADTTVLHWAATDGNTNAALQLLSRRDIDLSIKDSNGFTALHTAIFYNQAEIVSLLTRHNSIDTNAQNNDHATPLHMALFIDDLQNPDLQETNIKIVTALLEHPGTRVDVIDMDGDYPLHLAAYSENKEILALLLNDNRADVNVKNSEGLTPLEYITPEKNLDLYNWLVEHYPQYYPEEKAESSMPLPTIYTYPNLFAAPEKRSREESIEEENELPASKKPRND